MRSRESESGVCKLSAFPKICVICQGVCVSADVCGRQKADNERRIRMKKAQSNKKSSRRGDWD